MRKWIEFSIIVMVLLIAAFLFSGCEKTQKISSLESRIEALERGTPESIAKRFLGSAAIIGCESND